MVNGKPRVVILGGGFGGMYAALEFERALARGAALDVTLVNHDYRMHGQRRLSLNPPSGHSNDPVRTSPSRA